MLMPEVSFWVRFQEGMKKSFCYCVLASLINASIATLPQKISKMRMGKSFLIIA